MGCSLNFRQERNEEEQLPSTGVGKGEQKVSENQEFHKGKN